MIIIAEYSIEAELKANVKKFRKAIQAARDVTKKFKRESEAVEDTELDADIKPLKRNIKVAKKLMQKFTQSKNEVNIDADTSEAKRKMGILMAVKQALSRRVRIPITVDMKKAIDGLKAFGGMSKNAFKSAEKRVTNFQRAINRMANFMHSFGTVTQSMLGGIGLMFSSTLVPIIASLVPAIMAVGNAIGVLGSGVLALGAAFGIAGGLAVAFGAAAAPTIQGIIDGTAESTKENLKAMKALDGLKSAWQGVTDAIAPDVAIAFTNVMTGLEKVVVALQPTIERMGNSVSILSDQFNEFMDSKTATEFFDMLNQRGWIVFHNLASAVGNFGKGFMSLLTGFGPAIQDVSQGFQNMSIRFAEWADRVSKSKSLQKFVDYIKTNLPTVRKIFGDIFTGIINLFVAFGDNSQIIFDALSEMTGKFKTWSKNIKNSDGFQQFIDYVQENGPKVIDLIGNVVNFIIELGIALAPLGAKMLEIANAMISWTTELMRNNPLIGKLIGLATLVGGALLALVPFITMVVTAFKGFGKGILKVIPTIVRVGGVLLRFATGWIGLVIQAVISLAVIIYKNWDAIKAKTIEIWNAISAFFVSVWEWIKETFKAAVEWTKNAVSVAWNWIKETTSTVWNAIKEFFVTLWENIKTVFTSSVEAVRDGIMTAWNWIKETTVSVWNTIKEFFVTLWEGIKTVFTTAVESVTEFVTSKFGWLIEGIKLIFENVKIFFQNVWEIIKNIFVGAVLIILQAVTGDFEGMKESISQIMDNIKTAIGNIWEAIKTIFITVLDIIKNLLTMAWNGIKSVTFAVWNGIKSFFSSVWNGIKSIFTTIVNAIKVGISTAWNWIKNTTSSIWNGIKSFFTSTWNSIRSTFTSVVNSIKSFVSSAWNSIKSTTSSIWNGIKTFFTQTLRDLWNSVKEAFKNMVDSVKEGMRNAKTTVVDLWGEVTDFFAGVPGKMKEIGKNIIQGLIGGIKDMGQNLIDAATGVVDSAIQGAKNLLGINSPSKVFFQFGKWTDEGLINGIKSMSHKVAKTSQNLASTVTNSFNPNLDVQASQITSSLRGLKRSTTAQVQSSVNADVQVNSQQPAYINVRIGNSEFNTFVDDITNAQDRKAYRARKRPR